MNKRLLLFCLNYISRLQSLSMLSVFSIKQIKLLEPYMYGTYLCWMAVEKMKHRQQAHMKG